MGLLGDASETKGAICRLSKYFPSKIDFDTIYDLDHTHLYFLWS